MDPAHDAMIDKTGDGNNAGKAPSATPRPEDAAQMLEVLADLGRLLSRTGVPSSQPPDEQAPTQAEDESPPSIEARYRVLVEQIPAVVFMAVLDGGVSEAYVSPHIERMLGFTRDEWLDDPMRWYQQIHPEDRQRWSTEVAEMLSSGQPLKSVYRVIARDGHIVWFHCDAKLVRRKDGRPWFIHGVGVDITDLKQTEQALEEESAERERLQRLELERQIAKAEQSESRLAAIVESSEDAIVGKTLEGIITSWNAAATRIFGYRPQEIIGKSILTIIPPDRHAEEMEILRKIRAGERIEHFDTERITKSGQIISVSLTISPIKDSSGRVVGASKIARDITERKRMEHALRESEKYAAMGRVAAVLAHEINNPLEALTNTFYLLRRHPSLDESGQELAQIAELEIGRVSHIAKQTLGLYRQSARPIRVSLNRILSEILDVYARQFQNFGISVEKRFETEAQVMGFPVEIRQVFLNLIGNAIHAMPQGGRLRIKISGVANPRKAGPRRGVRISVIDTGVGIRREHRDRIFDPFFTTKSEKGTGLGLWVSRSIVQKLEGTIRARSCFLKGKATTCFSVFLPSVPSEEVQASVENAVHASL